METLHQPQPPDPCPSDVDPGRSSAGVWERLRHLLHRGTADASPVDEPSPVPPAPSPHAVADQLQPQIEALSTRLEELSKLITEHLVRQVPDPSAEALSDLGQSLERRLDDLSRLFRGKIEDDQTKTGLLQKLYEDLARYRDDFLFKHVVADIVHDLIRLDDRLDDMLAAETLESFSRADLIDRLGRFQGHVRRTLRRHGVETLRHTSETFDPTFQEAIDAVPVATAEDDQRVVRVRRRGFAYRGKVLRPEQVIVGQYITDEEHTHG